MAVYRGSTDICVYAVGSSWILCHGSRVCMTATDYEYYDLEQVTFLSQTLSRCEGLCNNTLIASLHWLHTRQSFMIQIDLGYIRENGYITAFCQPTNVQCQQGVSILPGVNHSHCLTLEKYRRISPNDTWEQPSLLSTQLAHDMLHHVSNVAILGMFLRVACMHGLHLTLRSLVCRH